MTRYVLLILGFVAVFCQNHFASIPAPVQAYLFFAGIVLLGIPHGAADLLVAGRNASEEKKPFSKLRFLIIYLSILTAFAVLLWFFPLGGSVLFLVFAAYHFGETDLFHYKTDSMLGKLFLTSYGMVILCVILLNHFEDVKPLLLQFDAGLKNIRFIDWLDAQK